jgi:hypothetical protein
MRILSGTLLGVLSIVFLALAYAQMAHAEPPDCQSALAKKLVELINLDRASGKENSILELQFELTTLKLAAATVESKSRTVETLLRKETADLEGRIKTAEEKDKGVVMGRLIELYRAGPEAEDEAKAIERIQETMAKFQKGDYRSLEARFRNHELAMYVHAMMKTREEKRFDERDAAILWLKSELSNGLETAAGRGSKEANLSEASSMVIRLTGVIGAPKTADELKTEIEAKEAAIGAEFKAIEEKYKTELNDSCLACQACTDSNGVKPAVRAEALAKAMHEVQGKMKDSELYKSKVKAAETAAEARKKGIVPKLDLTKTQDVQEQKTETKKEEGKKDETGEESGDETSIYSDEYLKNPQSTDSSRVNSQKIDSSKLNTPKIDSSKLNTQPVQKIDTSKSDALVPTESFFNWSQANQFTLPSDTIFNKKDTSGKQQLNPPSLMIPKQNTPGLFYPHW